MATCENFRSSQVWPFAISMDPRVKVQLPSESSSGSRVRTALVPVKLQDRVMISCRLYLKTPVISFASAGLAVASIRLAMRAPRASPTDKVSRAQFGTRSCGALSGLNA